jgi:hypothetical protein
MVSAIDCTCAELTGSGREATAAPKAIVIIVIVSGGKDALEKSFICVDRKMSAKHRAGRCDPEAQPVPADREASGLGRARHATYRQSLHTLHILHCCGGD